MPASLRGLHQTFRWCSKILPMRTHCGVRLELRGFATCWRGQQVGQDNSWLSQSCIPSFFHVIGFRHTVLWGSFPYYFFLLNEMKRNSPAFSKKKDHDKMQVCKKHLEKQVEMWRYFLHQFECIWISWWPLHISFMHCRTNNCLQHIS